MRNGSVKNAMDIFRNRAKPKTIVPCSHEVFQRLAPFTCIWFIAVFTPVLIDQSTYVAFSFT